MKILKVTGIVFLCIIALMLMGFSTYVYKHYPRKIDSFAINSSELNNKILIASQGSSFKNALVSDIIEKLENDSIYIKVIDVSHLDDIEEDLWQSIIIINTCIADKLNSTVVQFLNQLKGVKPVVLFVTAGDGRWKPSSISIDAISSASRMNNMKTISREILNQISINENIDSN